MGRGKTAFVTGGTGYIGSNLVRRLVEEGYRVHVLIRPTSNTQRLLPVFDRIHRHVFDGSFQSINEAVQLAKPDVVFHLSSFASIQYETKDIESMIDSNITFGTLLLEAMSCNQVHYLINTSSFAQHFNQEKYNPNSLYAATKQAYEDILFYYSKVYGIKAISLVLFDNFGPNDSRPKIMNLLYQAMKSKEPLAMTPGEQQLDLLYIDNVIDAYIQAASLLHSNRIEGVERYAVSNLERVMLKELVCLFERISGNPIPIIWGARDYRKGEIMVPWSEGTILPGWKPRISLEEGIQLFIAQD